MHFTWDPNKASANINKHGVSFEMAQSVFDDPFHLSILDSKLHTEERWITIGRSLSQNTLVVVHTYKTKENGIETIRIISARRATRKEIKDYEKGI
ncbi:MAG: BrnT family toxin [Deltaproteobacteria bacterium]|nr:BrnT family toxin [Deltaproteobacteria bacterium]